MTVLLSMLGWASELYGQARRPLFFTLFSLPIIGGMSGVLLSGLRGGIIGATLGAFVLGVLLPLIW